MNPYREPSLREYDHDHDCPMESAGHECLCYDVKEAPKPPAPQPMSGINKFLHDLYSGLIKL